jgi:hypothetical protein
VVLNLLAERIRQPREAAGVHPDVQVLPLGKRRADVLRIGITFDARLDRASAFGGAVSAHRAFRRLAVNLHKLGVVNVATERALDCLQIRFLTIASKRQLAATSQTTCSSMC